MVVASNRINLWRACRAALRTWTFSSRARRCSMDITPCLSGKPAAEACVELVSYSVESVSYSVESVTTAIGLCGAHQLQCGVGQLQCGVGQLQRQ